MEHDDARDLALDLMDRYGILNTGWRFEFDNGVARMGACHYGKRLITMSRHYTEHADPSSVRNTILHEIAHALTPGAKHGPVWKAMARRLGATPKACGKNPFYDSPEQVAKRQEKRAEKHATVEGKPFYRVNHPECAGKRYRVLHENTKSYRLVDEDGKELRAAKSLVYREGESAPTAKEMRDIARATNLAQAKGKPTVRIALPGYESNRYALVGRGQGERGKHTLTNLATGDKIRVSARNVRPENASEYLGARLLMR